MGLGKKGFEGRCEWDNWKGAIDSQELHKKHDGKGDLKLSGAGEKRSANKNLWGQK